MPTPDIPDDDEDIDTGLTTLETLALLNCRVREKCGTNEQGEDVFRDVRDVEEIKNFLSIAEMVKAQNEGVEWAAANERGERFAAALVTAYISARLKLSITGERDFDLVLPKPSPKRAGLRAMLTELKKNRDA